MNKILLSTFTLKIKNPRNEYASLDLFNGVDDFHKIFSEYLLHIFSNLKNPHSSSDQAKLYLTIEALPNEDAENRTIYGYFSSGVGGDNQKIRNIETGEDVLKFDSKHASFRDLFFWIKISKNTQSASLVLQRKSKYGIKILFQDSINAYLREKGYARFHVEVNNVVHGKVYQKMIEEGKLKKLSFIKKKIPGSIEEYYQNGAKPSETKGTLTTSISSTDLPSNYKFFINNMFTNLKSERIEITGSEEKFDELEFELELNGKKKTFYVVNRHRIQPDIDVTANVEIVDGEATIASLVKQAEELYNDILDMAPINVR